MPQRITTQADRPSEQKAITRLAGRKAIPTCMGLQASTCCMYSAEMKNHANMAAAHNTPMMLDTDRLRWRSRPSGTSGAATWDSIQTKATSSAADRPSSPSDWVVSQPTSLPPTMAYTASISAAVMVTAPAMSSRWRTAGAALSGSSARQAR